MNTETIVSRLEIALRQNDDGATFTKEFEAIKQLPTNELKSIAKAFFGGGYLRTRQQFLDRIWFRYQKLQNFRNEIARGVGSKSAA